jgi:hypothetical protein
MRDTSLAVQRRAAPAEPGQDEHLIALQPASRGLTLTIDAANGRLGRDVRTDGHTDETRRRAKHVGMIEPSGVVETAPE